MKTKTNIETGVTAIYVRRSVADRDNNSLSIESQKEECIRYVGEDSAYRIYCDNGFSGKDTEHRPAFLTMMQDARDGLISRIVVKKYDRFSRNLRDYLNVSEELDKLGVSVYSLTEPFNTSTKEGRLMRNNLLSFAEFERETIAGRVADAYSTRGRETGFYQGGVMSFGYRPEKMTVNGKNGSVLIPSEQSEALKKAYEQIKHEEKLDFETSQAIEKAIESGEKSQKEAEELLKSFEGMKQAMQDNPFTSMETMEKMEKIGDLMNELLDEKTKSQMQKLRESLKDIKLDPKDIQKYEEAFKLDDYMKSLDRTINLLEQVREQQKFESLSNSIEEAYKRQQQIASETQDLLEKQKSGELSKEEEQKLQDLQDQQQKLNKDLEELQKKSEEMVKNSKNQDLKNNPMLEDVKNIADRLKNNDHKKMGEEIQKDMQNKELDKAQQNQEKMLEFLEALKKNADQIKQMCMAGATQLDLSSYIRRAVQVSVDQEKLLNEIIDMPESFMRGQQPQIEGIIDFVSVQQVLVKQQGRTLQEDLDKLITSSFGIDPTVIEAISGTQTRFSNIVKNLEDRALSQAWNDQYEIIRCFNKLAGDLMRAQDGQGQGQGSSSSPMSAMQQFKNLTQRQLSLYQQMMQQQLMPQGSEALKQMAMEQRHIRESLEQLMREHRQQMNSLGRMNDVIDDMKDVETKILDPKMREKVKEKQKSIYDRMMRSQKAIKNRDEEDEERQAQKARELHQQEPEKPIGDIGSSSVDLSKDFTGDLREEYPESYKQLLNEYYKSLNIYGGEQK